MKKIEIFPYEMAAHLNISGEDACDFLQSQFSNDLRPFAPGQATYGLWLDVKGKVVADSWVYCEGPERFRVFSEHCPGALIAEKLERHIVADDVAIEVLSGASALAAFGAVTDSWDEGGEAALVLPGRRSIEPSREYVFKSVEARDAFLRNREVALLSEHEMQRRRLEAGVPMVPAEIGPGDLPGEGGLDHDAIAFDKGCFLGQEVVARMHNVGKATRGLYLVRGAGEMPECPQVLSNEEGKVLGELRTAYPDPAGWVGVALFKRRDLPTKLRLESGAQVIREASELRPGEKERNDG